MKPGENTNRGAGIEVANKLEDIEGIINSYCGKTKTIILQKYIEKPLLANKRKFDIRCFMLTTTINGCMKAYFYKDGYLRTSSKEFNLGNLSNKLVHLTNDAIQKKCDDYGKHEPGNKLSYEEFQRVLAS